MLTAGDLTDRVTTVRWSTTIFGAGNSGLKTLLALTDSITTSANTTIDRAKPDIFAASRFTGPIAASATRLLQRITFPRFAVGRRVDFTQRIGLVRHLDTIARKDQKRRYRQEEPCFIRTETDHRDTKE